MSGLEPTSTYSSPTATERIRAMLDERGVEWWQKKRHTCWKVSKGQEVEMWRAWEAPDGSLTLKVDYIYGLTPAQAIAATLGQEPWVNPTWERWHRSLRHDEIKSIGDAVEQLMYEAIEFGGDMGPNGNTYNGIDEGDVLTSGFINEWIERFESALGSCNCPNNCTNGERTETCEADETDLIPFARADSDDFKVDYIHVMECTECGHVYEHVNGDYEYCPRCGRKRRDVGE